MSYATTALITSEFKSTSFGASDPVTSDDVTQWCEDFSQYVDLAISARYAVPATTDPLLGTCKLIVKNFVAARIRRILNGVEDKVALELDEQANEILKQLVDGDIGDLNAPAAQGVGCVSYNQENDVQPTFELDTEQT